MIEELNNKLKSMYLEPKTKLRVDVDYVVGKLEEIIILCGNDALDKCEELEDFLNELKENMENHNKKLNECKDYANGWRYIVWVGGNDNYYKSFSLAQMEYHNWIKKGYDDVFLTEMQKDGTDKIIYSSEEIENGTVSK